MKRSIYVIPCIILSFVLLLASCTSTTNQTNTTTVPVGTSADSQESTTTPKGDIMITSDSVGYADATTELTWLPQEAFDSTNKPVAEYFKTQASEFVKKHPEVKIKLTAQTVNIQDAMAKLLIQASTGDAPDLASVDSFVLPSYWQYLQPVDDVLAENNIPLDSWFPFAQAMMKPADKIVAMWIDTDVRMLYYQKSLMDKAPADWDELITKASELTEEGYIGLLYPAGKNETTSCDIWPWFWAQGGQIVDDAGKPVFNEGANKEAMLNTLNFLKKTIDTGITPTRVTSFMTDGDMNTDVATGKVAMFIGGSWLAKQIGAIIGDDVFAETYELANIPVMAGKEAVTTCGGWTCGVFAKDDTMRKLAAQFAIDVYIGDAGNDGFTAATGNLPCRETTYDKSERFKTDAIAQRFKEALTYGKVRPGVEIYNYISTEFQVAISDVISGAETPEKALEKMAQNVDSQMGS